MLELASLSIMLELATPSYRVLARASHSTVSVFDDLHMNMDLWSPTVE